jgi:GNAT superfamily N-acetyltransferase
MQLRVRSSSPITGTGREQRAKPKQHKEQSSDWSLSSPTSNKSEDKFSSSPLRSESSSPVKGTRRTSNRLSIPSLSTSEVSSDNDEVSSVSSAIDDSSILPPQSAHSKRKMIHDDSSSNSENINDDMIDIINDDKEEEFDSFNHHHHHNHNAIDPTLQGLLVGDESTLAAVDETDRKLYEMAFNRAELSLQQQMANFPGNSASDALFKGNNKSGHMRRSSNSAVGVGRGKGKDLFSVLKQRARGPAVPSIRKIYFGTDVAINPWYSAPYPSEYHSESGELWICEFCLQYMKKPCTAQRHLIKCHGRLPPGDEIYRDTTAGISVFEINGRDSKLYCQNLCLLAKMFLDHKTLYYDVDPFLFYVLVEWRALGTGRFLNSFVGYFSKEKVNPAGFNVSCILTMPHHQRKGYGSFLIDFSYLLSQREGRSGSPEKPLSDLGLFSYVSFWKSKLLAYFSSLLPENLSSIASGAAAIPVPTVCKISTETGMTENDILATLEYLRMLRFDIFPDPSDASRQILKSSILIDLAAIEAYRSKIAAKPQLIAHDEFLRWQPYKCTK